MHEKLPGMTQRMLAALKRRHQLDKRGGAGERHAALVFHGLRKSAVVTLLEAGATDAEVSAITGQSREMVAHYSRQVNQNKLAAAAILKWEIADREGAR